VAGAVTQAAESPLLNNNGSSLQVTLAGTRIVCAMNGATLFDTTSTVHQAARLHGFGYSSNTQDGNNVGIDDFTYNPVTTGSLQPPVLL
jgi:hypothetical protein